MLHVYICSCYLGFANCVFQQSCRLVWQLFYNMRIDNWFCAGSQTESIPVQLYAVSENYSNLAKYFHQCLFSNCRYSLSYIPCCHCNWPHAGHFHHSPGKLLLSTLAHLLSLGHTSNYICFSVFVFVFLVLIYYYYLIITEILYVIWMIFMQSWPEGLVGFWSNSETSCNLLS